MFNGKRYITRGIENDIPLWVITYLWSKVDSMCEKLNEQTDYLQIFRIRTHNNEMFIEHIQEQPPVKEITRLKYQGNPINQKIYVIDDGEYSTMLLAEEY